MQLNPHVNQFKWCSVISEKLLGIYLYGRAIAHRFRRNKNVQRNEVGKGEVQIIFNLILILHICKRK